MNQIEAPLQDGELRALAAIVAELEPLDADTQDRIIGYLFDRYRIRPEEPDTNE